MTVLYLALFLLPIAATLFRGLPFVGDIIAGSYYHKIIFFTLKQALLSTMLSLLAGLPGAYLMTKRSFKNKKLVYTLYRIPFVLPSILTVLGFVIFYGNNGYLNKLFCIITGAEEGPFRILYSFSAVLLAHVFYNFPVIVSIISDTWSNLSEEPENAAKIDGANELRIFLTITLPRLRTAILSACSLVFLYCFSSFAIIMVLGGSVDSTTSEVEIYRLGRILLDTDKASALAIVSSFVACLMLVLYRKAQLTNKTTETAQQRTQNIKHPVLAHLYLVVSTLFVLAPVVSIILRSFFYSASRTSHAVFSLRAYSLIDFKTIVTTCIIGLVSALLSTTMALGFCRKNIKTDIPVILPLATSSVILGLGYFMISKYFSFVSPTVMIILVHSVINTGFAYKSIEPAFSKIPQSLKDQAKTDGAGNFLILRKIEMPLVSKSIITAFLFSFVLSCGELNSTLVLGYGDIQTIPVAIYRMIGSYNYQGACALGTILIILCFLMFYSA